MVVSFSEIRNLGVRADVKREDDNSGLGFLRFEVLVGHIYRDVQCTVAYMDQILREVNRSVETNWQSLAGRW